MGDGNQSDETTGDAIRFDPSTQDSGIEYRRLRTPKQHGQSLQVPELIEIDQLWNRNLATENSGVKLGDDSLDEVQQLGRRELLELATRYSQSYTDINVADRSSNRIIMSGHQPELFHPGVWYKNFVLSELGSRFNATPINLVVDNDICGTTSIPYPNVVGEKVSLGTIPIVQAGPNVPFEARAIEDLVFFQSFQTRVADSIRNLVQDPLIHRLWPHVMEAVNLLAGDSDPRLGQSIAAGRHRFENEVGLKTLEVPVSQISQTTAFAIFVKSILLDVSRFQSAYNQSLSDYRKVHRIRSRSHPVPELEVIDGWHEVPLWIWQSDRPERRRLFIKQNPSTFVFSDGVNWQSELEINSFVEQFCELGQKCIAIRPRALMTTMFSRLVLSDLFIHGIGGAKYDQLTNVIAERFYSAHPPGFLTLSATMKLPTDLNIVRREDLVRSAQLLRNLKFHPESHIAHPSPQAQQLIREKRDWTIGPHQNKRSKQKHEAIKSLNSQLAQYIDVDPNQILANRSEYLKQVRTGEILDSREYSFCLFPDSLIAELTSLVTV